MSNYDQFSSEELLQVIEEYGRAEAEKERERIIKLLIDTPQGLNAILACAAHDGDGSEIEALIRGENE